MEINRNQIYEVEKYCFRNFITLSDLEKEKVWRWRNEESIRRFMYNKEIIPYENHLNFIASLTNRNDVYYWLVEKEGEIVGVTNLTNVNLKDSRAELGYYMVPEMQKKGIGIDYVFNSLLFAFKEIHVNTLFGAIDKHNYNALALDTYLGFILNQKDISSLNEVDYIRWEMQKEDFLNNLDGKNDFRQFVRYMRDNKVFFDKMKQYAE